MLKPWPFEIGRVVLSRAGRDAGRALVVLSVEDEQHVRVADGALRTVAQPKKKKTKHLLAKPACIADVQDKLSRGAPLLDADVRKALAALGYEPGNRSLLKEDAARAEE